MNREESLALVREFVKNEGLIKHMLSVETSMRFYAEKFDEDVEAWGQLGLIHDFDWEIHPTARRRLQIAREYSRRPTTTCDRQYCSLPRP